MYRGRPLPISAWNKSDREEETALFYCSSKQHMSSSGTTRCSIVMSDEDGIRVHTATCPKDISLNTLSQCVAQVFGKSKILLKDPSSKKQIKTDEELHQYFGNHRARFLAEVDLVSSPSLFGPITQSIFAERNIVVNESATTLHQLIPRVEEAQRLTVQYRMMLGEPELPLFLVETVAHENGHSYKSLLEEIKDTRSKWHKQKLGKEIQESRESFKGQPLLPSPNPGVVPFHVKRAHQEIVSHPTCGRCQQTIAGVHYQCLHCIRHIMCTACESLSSVMVLHPPEHVFAKIYPSSQIPLSKPQAKKVSMERIVDRFPPPSYRDALSDRIDHLEEEVVKLMEQMTALEKYHDWF